MIGTHHSSIFFQDDGFGITAAEPWIRDKVNILQQYVSAFVANLAGRVDDIVLVDLFTGNGLYSLGSKKELFPGSALTALSLELPINKFVLCEKDADQSKTLKIRTNRYFREKNIVLLEGKPEDLIEKLSMYVPRSKDDYRVAVLCICDPFSLEIPFDTLDKLGEQGFSFLIPFTFVLNDHINYHYYLDESRDKIKKFLGGYRDVERLEKDLESNVQFYKRLVQIHQSNMLANGLNGSTSVHKLDSGLMEMPWYYVGFYSKQFSTKAIQQDVEAARNVQFELF